MSSFEWTTGLSVGNAAIDADHQELFALIRELEDADASDKLLADILARLEAYAAGHFAREEAYMQKMGFPGFDAHVREHRNFVEWLETVKATYRRSTESAFEISDMVNAFLEQWLTEHIMVEDMKYRDFLVGQNPG